MQQCAALKAIFAKAFEITKKAIRHFKILHNFKFLKNSLVPIIFQDCETLNVRMILWHLFSIRALNKDNTMAAWMQNWPDVCSALYKLREIWEVQFPAHCFCYLTMLILFFSPALLYFSPFVSLRNNFSFHLHFPYTPPTSTLFSIFHNMKSHPEFRF